MAWTRGARNKKNRVPGVLRSWCPRRSKRQFRKQSSLNAGRKEEATPRNVSGKIFKFEEISSRPRKYGGGRIKHYPSREPELIGGRIFGGRERTKASESEEEAEQEWFKSVHTIWHNYILVYCFHTFVWEMNQVFISRRRFIHRCCVLMHSYTETNQSFTFHKSYVLSAALVFFFSGAGDAGRRWAPLGAVIQSVHNYNLVRIMREYGWSPLIATKTLYRRFIIKRRLKPLIVRLQEILIFKINKLLMSKDGNENKKRWINRQNQIAIPAQQFRDTQRDIEYPSLTEISTTSTTEARQILLRKVL